MFSKPKYYIWHFNAHYLKSGFITIAPQQNHFYIRREQNKPNYPARTCAAVVKYSVGVSLCIYIYCISSILTRAILFKIPFGSEVFEGES